MRQSQLNLSVAALLTTSFLFTGCSSRDAKEIAVKNFQNGDINVYQDSYMQVFFPLDWTVDTSNNEVTAALIDSELNQFGGYANCSVRSVSTPGSSITEQTSMVIADLDATPEPDVDFFTVDSQPTSRLRGSLTSMEVTVESAAQLIYDVNTEYTHTIFCLDTEAADSALILDSMFLIQ